MTRRLGPWQAWILLRADLPPSEQQHSPELKRAELLSEEKPTTGLPGGSAIESPPCERRRRGFDPLAGNVHWRGTWQTIPGCLPGEIPWTGGAWRAAAHKAAKD